MIPPTYDFLQHFVGPVDQEIEGTDFEKVAQAKVGAIKSLIEVRLPIEILPLIVTRLYWLSRNRNTCTSMRGFTVCPPQSLSAS